MSSSKGKNKAGQSQARPRTTQQNAGAGSTGTRNRRNSTLTPPKTSSNAARKAAPTTTSATPDEPIASASVDAAAWPDLLDDDFASASPEGSAPPIAGAARATSASDGVESAAAPTRASRARAAVADQPPATDDDQGAAETSALRRPPFRQRAATLATDLQMRLRAVTPEQWVWFGILFLAAILRFWGLGDRPLHHDESMHAYFSLQFAENPGGYAYNPLLHGPFQFHAEGLMFAVILGAQAIFVHGAVGNPWINDTTARFLPVLFGLGIVALPFWLRRELGRVGALVASFLLAVSPTFVYFSRFLREDIYFNFFMFAMVVSAIRFAHSRSTKWFIALFAATVFAYATFEGTFLTLAIFGGFLALLFVWDLAHGVERLLPQSFTGRERIFFARSGLLLILGAIAAIVAKVSLQKLGELSTYINNYSATDPKYKGLPSPDIIVRQWEDRGVSILLFASIAVALLVIATLLWQMYRDDLIYGKPQDYNDIADDEEYAQALQARYNSSFAAKLDRVVTAPSRAIGRLRKRLDPQGQSFIYLLLSITWVQWFVAFVVAWLLFAALFWIIPPGPADNPAPTIGAGFQRGVGLGLLQGLYYWLQQQDVARGGQPWYYYLLVMPLYEQLVCIFGVGGIIYSALRPTRFRMFLVWWFVASLGIYSWAGEKMPWLTIHILLPLFLLAAIVLARLLQGAYAAVLRAANDLTTGVRSAGRIAGVVGRTAIRPAVLGVLAALLLLVPMMYSMLTLTQVDAANAPNEMLIYVQTSPDWQLVMNKIEAADQKLDGGKHTIRIGVGVGMEWPSYWYFLNYPNTFYAYDPTAANAPQVDVMVLAQWEPDGQQYFDATPQGYTAYDYKLRWWWDEGYKPLPCVPSKTTTCPTSDALLYGEGLGPWLTYGTAQPKGQPAFQPFMAFGRVWNWLWTRTPIGSPNPGSTDFIFVVRSGVPTTAAP
jgi:predicted membrane-bound mannosyltransferase